MNIRVKRDNAFRAMSRSAAGLLLATALLSACTAIAPPAEENSDWSRQRNQLQDFDSWELRGRVNVRYDNESHTPRINWLQQNVEYHIRLWGTFNAGNTLIVGHFDCLGVPCQMFMTKYLHGRDGTFRRYHQIPAIPQFYRAEPFSNSFAPGRFSADEYGHICT